jgi:ketopantoate hydroxymethyltransferase
MIANAMKAYADEVRNGQFPGDEHCYNMMAGEEEKFLKLIES